MLRGIFESMDELCPHFRSYTAAEQKTEEKKTLENVKLKRTRKDYFILF